MADETPRTLQTSEPVSTGPLVGEVWREPLPLSGQWCHARCEDAAHPRIPWGCTRPAHDDGLHVAGAGGAGGYSGEPRELMVAHVWREPDRDRVVPSWVPVVPCAICGEALLDPVVVDGVGALCVDCAQGGPA